MEARDLKSHSMKVNFVVDSVFWISEMRDWACSVFRPVK